MYYNFSICNAIATAYGIIDVVRELLIIYIYYYLAIQDGKVVGFATVHFQYLLHHLGKVAELQELVVVKGKQGLGIGSLLFEKIKEIAMENECILLEVCCNQIREFSHKFYLKQGMKNSHYKFTLPLPCTK